MPASQNTLWSRWLRIATVDRCAIFSLITIFLWNARRGFAPGSWHNDDAWVVAVVSSSDSFTELVNLGFTHPGFNIVLRAITQGSADSFGFQAIPILAAAAAIAVLYYLVKNVVGSAVGAWVMLLAFSGSYLMFRFSVAVKPYSMEVFAFAVALLLTRRSEGVTNRAVGIWVTTLGPACFFDARLAFISMVTAAGLFWGRKMSMRQLVGLAAGHAVIAGPILLFLRSRFDGEDLKNFWRGRPGAFANGEGLPVRELVRQTHRATRVVFNGPPSIGWILLGLIVLGVAVGIWKRDAAATASAGALGLAMGLSVLEIAPFGPEQLGNQRIDLWLAPALFVLGATGIRFIVDSAREHITLPTLPSLRPTAGFGAVAALMLIAPLLSPAFINNHFYPDQQLDRHFAFALNQAATFENTILVGPNHSGVEVQFAALSPDSIVDLSHRTDTMRGLLVELDPHLYRANSVQGNDALLAATDRVIILSVFGFPFQQLHNELSERGFERSDPAHFPLIEVWIRPDSDE